MIKVIVYSLLLISGLAGSQILPGLTGAIYPSLALIINELTLVALSFIMIQVGFEFEIEKNKIKSYGWDYIVAMSAAALPWIFIAFYFMFIMLPDDLWTEWDAWKEILLASRFAAPTSAGVLFSMLTAAGLGTTWMFRKTRVLAIFDDLDTVLLMIPLKMMIVGLVWQLGFAVFVMVFFLSLAWIFMHRLSLPTAWNWIIIYSAVIVFVVESVYFMTKSINPDVPIHIEVLLPAFVLGVMLKNPDGAVKSNGGETVKAENGFKESAEQRASTIISGLFMLLVGLHMPMIFPDSNAAVSEGAGVVSVSTPGISSPMIALHVFAVTVLSNIGKMLPAFAYRQEAHLRERLAVAIGMWPRGEVGAGIIIISLGYGIGGPVVTVAVLSLALNLLLTGFFILTVKHLLNGVPESYNSV